jgi:Glutathione-dependent formaldehyde-activating enzyme
MQLPQTGGCQCGKFRYEISEAPQLVYTCHCTDCQRLTSSAFSMGVVVAETGFRLSGIEPRRLQRTADSGRVTTRHVPGVRFLGLRHAAGWLVPGARRHTRRYLVVAADKAYLDPQQAALDHIAGD